MKSHNFCIILAGGVGKRLWPVSRQQRPKQFIDFFGVGKSLLQLTFERISAIVPPENIYICTSEEYAALAHEQLPGLSDSQFLLEPVRLSTGPAAVRATWHIARRCPEASILAVPADQFITNEMAFHADVLQAFEYVGQHRSFLALGIKAQQPNTAYGYIQRGRAKGRNLYEVKTFTEKPEKVYAETFVRSGEFLWNTGLFLWKAEMMTRLGHELLPGLYHSDIIITTREEEDDIVQSCYPAAERVSLDCMLLEQNQQMDVMECNFGWCDVGSWTVMQKVLSKTSEGNAVVVTPPEQPAEAGKGSRVAFRDSSNTIVSVPEGVATLVQGLNGYLVALKGNVLVITPNDDSARIKSIVTQMQVKFGEEYL